MILTILTKNKAMSQVRLLIRKSLVLQPGSKRKQHRLLKMKLQQREALILSQIVDTLTLSEMRLMLSLKPTNNSYRSKVFS